MLDRFSASLNKWVGETGSSLVMCRDRYAARENQIYGLNILQLHELDPEAFLNNSQICANHIMKQLEIIQNFGNTAPLHKGINGWETKRWCYCRHLKTYYAEECLLFVPERDPVLCLFNCNSNVWKMHLKIIFLVCKKHQKQRRNKNKRVSLKSFVENSESSAEVGNRNVSGKLQ